ncbi:YhdP family protein [Aquisalimonas lutea]|uniref:YhdP family protein n=1 Tax=Aquisalimonas lutea TaxID=1327750 RepID=UPI0025B358FB|nr:YhdP family protein [Aquisalimonas lutea]MDN3517329.1 YhdP family protein [Aquisalimonas lutea]
MTLLRKLLRLLAAVLAAAVVLLAVALALVRAGVHFLPEYRAEVEDRIGALIEQTVEIRALDAAWVWSELRITLEGVRLGEGVDRLSLPRLEINLDLYASLLAGAPRVRDLVIVEPRVAAVREADGSLRLAGLAARDPGLEILDALMAQPGRLRIADGYFELRDRIHGRTYRFPEVDAAVDDHQGQRRFAGTATLPEAWGERVRFVTRWAETAAAPVTEGPLEVYLRGESVQPVVMERLLGRPEAAPYVALGGSLEAWARFPGGVPQSDGRERRGDVTLRASSGSAELPYLFRQPIPFASLEARLDWRLGADGWMVNLHSVAVDNEDGAVTGRVRVDKTPGAAPFLDVRASVEGRPGNAVNTGRYLPAGVLPPDLVDWLDRSIVAGTAERAEVLIHGPADRFPYDDGTGRFEVTADVTGASLAFLRDWPSLTDLDGRLRFQGRSMRIDATHGRMGEATIREARASISDLEGGRLEVQGRASGPGNAYLDFLRAMPPSRELLASVPPLRLDGEHDLALDLAVPLGGGPVTLNGRLQLNGGRLRLPEQGLSVQGLRGEVRFDRRGIEAEAVRGRFLGSPLRLDLSTDGVDVERPRIHATAVLPELAAEPLASVLSLPQGMLRGRAAAEVRAGFPAFGRDGEQRAPGITLRASSDLEGMAVTVPAPFGKEAGAARAVEVATSVNAGAMAPLHVRYGDDVDARLDVGADGGLRRGAVRFGGEPATLPESGRVRLDGALPALDVLAWRRWLGDRAGDGMSDGPVVDAVDVTVGTLSVGDLAWTDQRVRGQRDVTGWTLELAGQGLAGTLQWPASAELAVEADLDRLHLDLPDGAAAEAADGSGREPLAGVEPSALPGLRVRVEELVLNGMPLGRLQVLGDSDLDGYALGNILLRGDHHSVTGRAAWRRDAGGERTELALDVRSDDMGALLAGLGYQDVIRDGSGRGSVDLSMRSAPLPPALDTLSGEFELFLRDGYLTQVEPGAGRVFGLLSVANLPRRLALNFSDVFEEGFAFDRIDADLTIRNGIAEPEKMVMEGPSARVEATGSVDIAARAYDQVITVTPKASTTLPLLGGVFGGPAGAAAMLLAQQVFSDQLDQVAQLRYRLTGPWTDPVLEPLPPPGQSDPPAIGAPLQ